MPSYSLLLSAALLLTAATSPDAFAQGRPAAKKVIQIESMGARAFGGTTVPMPDDPTNIQACDHGFAEWFIRVSEHFPGGQIPGLPGRLAVDRAGRQGLR
jgi:hypothetical protein